MTLHDAFLGLLRYWKLRPNGGTKSELLALAVQQGFEEPLLAEWLGVFVNHFAASKRITVADYDTGLAPLVAEIGVEAATIAASEVYEYLLRDGRALDAVKKIDRANGYTAEADQLTIELSALSAARAKVQSDFTGANKVAATTAIDEATDRRTRLRTSLRDRAAELLDEA